MFKCFLFAVFGFALIAPLHAQDQSGFISIDCGSSSSYTDQTTGIEYVTDATFIDTGVSNSVSVSYRIDANPQLLWTLRSFPEATRNCYNVGLLRSNRYLIRATFLYGNYDGQGKIPQFDMHVGPNVFDSVIMANESTIITKEIIHMPTSNYIDICLVNTGRGTPFISGLEFRLLKNTTYVSQSGSLDRFARLDVASTTNETIRFKDDVYDRIWAPYHYFEWAELRNNGTIDATGSNDFHPPANVMRSAATPINEDKALELTINMDDPTSKFYVYLHFCELVVLNANQSRSFNISLNGNQLYGPVVPDYLFTTTIYTPTVLSQSSYKFSIQKTENSTLPPILNGIEFFTVKDLFQSETVPKDVDAILSIKSVYALKRDWGGDPCAPLAYVWDGVNCSYSGYDPPKITSLDLSSSGLIGEIAPSLSNLTNLQSLDLSNNNLTGPVPEFLSQLPLTVLNLQDNMLTGSVPIELIKKSEAGLLSLSVGGNSNLLCSSISCKKKKTSVVAPVVASVAALLFLLIVAFATFLGLKRKKQHALLVGKHNKTNESLELKKRRFTYSEILEITNNLETIIGEGGFGKVYLGFLEENEVAVKILSLSSRQGYTQFLAEVKLLMRVHHRNLTTLVGYCDEDDTKIALVYEYMANGNLSQHLSGVNTSSSILSWEGRLRIAMEAGQGLEYLHNGCKPPIVHRDVKTANILLNDKFQAKMADFGLSKSFPVEGGTNISHVSTVVAGTPGYLDPEYYVSSRLSEKSDVFSFGVVLLEIITCRPVITNTEENNHISQWVSYMLTSGDINTIVDPRLQGDFDTNSVWKAVELAMACVSQSSSRRPNMNQIVVELKECLAMELNRRQGRNGNDQSQDSYEMFTVNMTTGLAPLARDLSNNSLTGVVPDFLSELASLTVLTYDSFELKSRQFTYSEILKITNNFERVLGKGGFGTVYEGCVDDSQLVAVKMLSQSSAQGYKQFQTESITLDHYFSLIILNLTTNQGCKVQTKVNQHVLTFFSMDAVDRNIDLLNWEERLQIAIEAAQGLEYLHNGCKPPIIHRDVKSTNILLNEKLQAKLADFGLSRTFQSEGVTHVSTIVAGTPGYLDPEYYISNRLNEKSDVYSFGIVLLEIISSRPVIAENYDHEKTHITQWVNLMLAKGDINNMVDPNLEGQFDTNSVWKAVEIAMTCVSPTPNTRPNMNHVVMELNECLAIE
ncbi:Pkinase domain-containing protein/Malectin_like domain-containing protein/LRR_8 domain-containing protein, partial [Cephalotus follicularis]